jgi:hypothetical protein
MTTTTKEDSMTLTKITPTSRAPYRLRFLTPDFPAADALVVECVVAAVRQTIVINYGGPIVSPLDAAAAVAKGFGPQGFFFGEERRRATGGEAGLEFFGLFLRAAVIRKDVEETTVRAVGPREEGIGAAIERVEEPDFVGVFREAAAIEDARDHAIAATMTGENDPAHREVLRFEISAGAERGDDLGHEAFETIGVL